MEDFAVKMDERRKKEAEEAKGGKKKIKYNAKGDSDESDVVSDSDPSDDNLDSDQLLKLIPKKCGKVKYLRGVEKVAKP